MSDSIPYVSYSESSSDPSESLYLTRNPKEKSALPADIDSFLIWSYNYFTEHGFWCGVLSRVLNLAIFSLIGTFLFIMGSFLDWTQLFEHQSIQFDFSVSRVPIAIWIIGGIYSLIWLYRLRNLLFDILKLYKISLFYNTVLGISDEELLTKDWSEIVQLLITQARIKDSPLAMLKNLDPLIISLRILRNENYVIAMISNNILPESVFGLNNLYTKVLETILNLTVWNTLFDSAGLKAEVFKASARERLVWVRYLKFKFYLIGLLSLVFSPVIFIFLLTYIIFRHGESIRSTPGSLIGRQWTRYAEWRFRCYNELKHYFHNRLKKSSDPASKYLDQFPAYLTGIILSFSLFLLGTLTVLTIGTSLVQPDVLNIEILDRTLWWWIGMFSMIIYFTRPLIPDKSFIPDHKKYHEDLCTNLKVTNMWKNPVDPQIKYELKSYFRHDLRIFVGELMSVLYIPFYVLFTLPGSADKIVQFFQETTVQVEGLGRLCSYAAFVSVPSVQHDSVFRSTVEGNHKMEASIVSFKNTYPLWQFDQQRDLEAQ